MKLNDIFTDSAANAAATVSSDEPSLNCTQPQTALPAETPIGMLYVPYQKWQKIYDPQIGLGRGTIFEELDKPFIGERAV